MSSSSTAFLLPEDLPEDSNSSLSFKPSFNSGMPDKNDLGKKIHKKRTTHKNVQKSKERA